MAVGDFITRGEVEGIYNIAGFHQELFTADTDKRNAKIAKSLYNSGYSFSTIAKTPENSIAPNNNVLLMRYNTNGTYVTEPILSITNTKTFKIVMSDHLSVDVSNYMFMMVRINHGVPVEITKNFKRSATGNPYIIYELNDLDPTRVYTIEIYCSYHTGISNVTHAFYMDSTLIDKDGVYLPGIGMGFSAHYDDKLPLRSKTYFDGNYSYNLDRVVLNKPSSYDDNKRCKEGNLLLLKYNDKQVIPFNEVKFYGGIKNLNYPLNGMLGKLMDQLTSTGIYEFAVHNADKITFTGVLFYYESHSSIIDVYVDNIYQSNINNHCGGSDSNPANLKVGSVIGEVKLPDRNTHIIKIVKRNTLHAYFDCIVVDKSALIIKDGDINGMSILNKANVIISKPLAKTLTYINTETFRYNKDMGDVYISGKNRYRMKTSDNRYIVPKSSNTTIKTPKSYPTVADMPNIVDNSVYTVAAYIAKKTNPLFNGCKSFEYANSILAADNPGLPASGNYGGTIYSTTRQRGGSTYYGNVFSIWYDYLAYYNRPTDLADMLIYYPMFNNFLVPSKTAFKTTSSFFSIWNPINLPNVLSELDYLIFINGIFREHVKTSHPTDNSLVSYRKVEIARIDGISPDDFIEVYTLAKEGVHQMEYGFVIDENADVTYMRDSAPAYEIVSEEIYNNLPDTLKMFKAYSKDISTIANIIMTQDNTIDYIDISSDDDISNGVYFINSDSKSDIDKGSLIYSGYNIKEISNNPNLLDKINNEGYKLISKSADVYGLLKSDYDLVEVKSVDLIKSIADKDIFIDKKPESATIAISANVATSGDYGIREYSFPKNTNITKVVI